MDSHPFEAQSTQRFLDGGQIHTLHDRLRTETATAHQQAENDNPFLQSTLTLQSYAQWMAQLSCLWGALETWSVAHVKALTFVTIPDASVCRLSLIQADLSQFRQASVTPLPGPHLPHTIAQDSLSAAGCLYVLIGSRLGGHIIGRRLVRHLAPVPQRAFSFWHDDARRARSDLKSYLKSLDKLLATPQEVDRVVLGAKTTFDIWSHWMKQDPPSL